MTTQSSLRLQRGVALLLALMMMALLTAIASAYSRGNRVSISSTDSFVHRAKARAIAEAGIYTTLWTIVSPQQVRSPSTLTANGTVTTIPIGDQVAQVSLRDLAGLIDINAAGPELLNALVGRFVDDPERVTSIVDAIQDWRDGDHDRRTNGAEDADYRGSGRQSGAKDGPFNTVDELLLVAGMTPEIFARLRPLITVASGYPAVRADVAPTAVLEAIPGLNPESIAALRAAQGTPALQSVIATMPEEAKPFLTAAAGRNYEITSEADIDGTHAAVVAMVEISLGRARPYVIWAWQEGRPSTPPAEAANRVTL